MHPAARVCLKVCAEVSWGWQKGGRGPGFEANGAGLCRQKHNRPVWKAVGRWMEAWIPCCPRLLRSAPVVEGLRGEDAGGRRRNMGSCVHTENNHDVCKESHGAGASWLWFHCLAHGGGRKKGMAGGPEGLEQEGGVSSGRAGGQGRKRQRF